MLASIAALSRNAGTVATTSLQARLRAPVLHVFWSLRALVQRAQRHREDDPSAAALAWQALPLSREVCATLAVWLFNGGLYEYFYRKSSTLYLEVYTHLQTCTYICWFIAEFCAPTLGVQVLYTKSCSKRTMSVLEQFLRQGGAHPCFSSLPNSGCTSPACSLAAPSRARLRANSVVQLHAHSFSR